MKSIDPFSYHCGVIDCFNEMIQLEVKIFALSHPISKEENSPELRAYIRENCKKHGTKYYFEESLLKSRLFPFKENISVYLFYKDRALLQSYQTIKKIAHEYEKLQQFAPEIEKNIAVSFAQLLSYPEVTYEAMIKNNTNR